MEQIRGAVENIPGPIKLGAFALIAVAVLWFAWNTAWGMLRNWQPIAVEVDGPAKAEVLDFLRTNNVDYKIEGGTILVPADRAEELRIEMAGLDLAVTQLKGLERLESVGMGDTEKTIAAKRQLALQEEIQKALNALNAVDTSQVNLALPNDSGFISRDQAPAKASIMLKLRSGAELSAVQVRGIQNLVANSIQGLTPENVTIVDQDSNPLSQTGEGNMLLTMKQMDEEKRIIQNIRSLLEPTLGPNRVTVAANVELNRESREETRKEIDTTRSAEVEFSSLEEEENNSSNSGGVPGTETNTGEGVAGGGGGSGGSRTKTEEKRRAEFPTTLTNIKIEPGEIKSKSVSVVIDLKEEVTADENGQQTTNYVSWGDETLNGWTEALKRAAGIDEQRGDTLSLTEISFDNLHQMSEKFELEQQSYNQRRMYDIFDWNDWTALVKIPVLIIVLFAIFWWVVRPIGRAVLEPILQLPSRAAAQIPQELPKTVEELEAEIEGKLEDELDVAAKEVTKGTILKKRIAELAKSEPESFTQLLRSWLNE